MSLKDELLIKAKFIIVNKYNGYGEISEKELRRGLANIRLSGPLLKDLILELENNGFVKRRRKGYIDLRR